MRSALPLLGLLLLSVACGSRNEGTLGIEPTAAARAIDVAKLTDAKELDRALRQDLDQARGAYSRAIKTDLTIEGGADKPETLTLSGSVISNGKDRVRVLHDTSHEDGYEAILENDRLHVRPRYLQMTWHRPEPNEVATLRAPVEHATADYVGKLPKPTLTKEDKGDRIAVTVTSTAGTARLELDPKTGALLAAVLDAKLTLDRNGKPITITVKHEDKTTREAVAIEAPADSRPTPRRPRPQLDKQQLLPR